MTIEAVAEKLKERVAQSAFDSVLKFDCGDDGVLVINGNELSMANTDADCTVGITLADLMAMVDGELNPAAGFMQGRLKVDGDMGVAMKLNQVL